MKPLFGPAPAAIALAAAALSLTGCKENMGQGRILHVSAGHVEMAATPDRPAAGYFTVKGGPRDVKLVAVTIDLAQRTEMHESIKDGAMMTMKEIRSADVPANGELEFKRGGKHLMIWNINPAAVKAGKLPAVFLFSNNDRILFDLVIKPADAAAAKAGMEHQGH